MPSLPLAMATLGQWTRELLNPAPMQSRPRWLHWLAWFASIISVLVILNTWGGPSWADVDVVRQLDLWIAVGFAAEFFTRSGFRQDKWKYAKWRWFDFLAMIPVIFLVPYLSFYQWFIWIVLGARIGRLVDRTLGDGFVKRHFLAFTEAIEEEISDRVLLNIMGRIEGELQNAKFGETAAKAISVNKESILQRIYAEQMPETGAMSRVANITGLQGAIEKMEARVFDAIIKIIGSSETDALIKDVVTQSLSKARAEIAEKSWRGKVGLQKPAVPPLS